MKLITNTLLCFAIFFPSITFTNVIYVNQAAAGLNNGTSWLNAFIDLQDALNSTPAPDTIWIAEGTYFPTNGTDRYIYFQIPSGVAIFGGFEGTETQLSQRDWETHQTILSGDIGEQGDHSDNSFSVLYAAQTDTTTTIDGLNIMLGNANSVVQIDPTQGPSKSGGGLYVDGQGNYAFIKINNCIFLENQASITGGAIHFFGNGGATGFYISNTTFINNSSNSGGAITKYGECDFKQSFVSCRFENNNSVVYGGAYWTYEYGEDVNLVFQDCEFINNKASQGGAIARYNLLDVNINDLIFINCLFDGNEVSLRGGAISDETISSTGDILAYNCVFQSNHANQNGGAIYIESDAPKNLYLTHSSFKENKSVYSGGAVWFFFIFFRFKYLFNK